MSAYKTLAQAEIQLEDLTDRDQNEGLLVNISAPPETINPLSLENDTWTQKNSTHCEGWRGGALRWAALATLVFIVNASTFVWLMARNEVDVEYAVFQLSQSPLFGKISELYRGDCGKVKQMNIWIHLVINIMSTLLLTGSNYCMQCLSAPTRGMIDIAHGKNKCYNAAFFSTISCGYYTIYFVSQDFLDGDSYNDIAFRAQEPSLGSLDKLHGMLENGAFQRNLNTFERLENVECISAYAANFLNGRGTLAIVTSNTTATYNNYNDSSGTGLVNMTAEGVLGVWRSHSWMPGESPGGDTSGWYNHPGKYSNNSYDPFDWFVTRIL
ncbi:hypothetical protein LTR50_001115 [Elasticomyces elasticus]|nr:hypothetical protein LTR50_001115 [Elasticomyces elasticus]